MLPLHLPPTKAPPGLRNVLHRREGVAEAQARVRGGHPAVRAERLPWRWRPMLLKKIVRTLRIMDIKRYHACARGRLPADGGAGRTRRLPGAGRMATAPRWESVSHDGRIKSPVFAEHGSVTAEGRRETTTGTPQTIHTTQDLSGAVNGSKTGDRLSASSTGY